MTKQASVGKILIVDDSVRDVELMLEALSDSHLANEVTVAHDGVDALDYLRREGSHANREPGNPVVVLLDLKMPRLDGLAVLREIRADDNLRLIPVVIMTSSREEQDLIRSYELGTNAYVVKPVDFGDFMSAVKRLGIFWAVVNECVESDR